MKPASASFNTAKKSESTLGEKILGWLIAVPLIAVNLMWYNHVWVQYPISFWQWLPIAAALTMISGKPTKMLFSVIFGVAILAQVASWVGLIALPLIHIHQ